MVNGILPWGSDYNEKIRNYLKNELKEAEGQNARDVVARILPHLTIEGDARFQQRIGTLIGKISSSPPGRELLNRLSRALTTPLTIRPADTEHCFDKEDNSLSFYTGEKKVYYIGADSSMLMRSPNKLHLAHEMGHALHYNEDRDAATQREETTDGLIAADFGDLEEQLTICGLQTPHDALSLCDNLFLSAYGKELRLGHQGILSMRAPEEFRLDECILLGAWGNCVSILEKDPEALQTLYRISDWIAQDIIGFEEDNPLFHCKLTPLSVALLSSAGPVDLLEQAGADPYSEDEAGGPLLVACGMGKFARALKWLDRLPGPSPRHASLYTLFLQHYAENEMDHCASAIIVLQKLEAKAGVQEKTPLFLRLLALDYEDDDEDNFTTRIQGWQNLVERAPEQLMGFRDDEGNNALMSFLRYLEGIPHAWYRSEPQVQDVISLIRTLVCEAHIDVAQPNDAGRTAESVAQELGGDKIAGADTILAAIRSYRR